MSWRKKTWEPLPLEDILPDRGRGTVVEFNAFCKKHAGPALDDRIARQIEKKLFFGEALDAARLHQLANERRRANEQRWVARLALALSVCALVVSVLSFARAWKP